VPSAAALAGLLVAVFEVALFAAAVATAGPAAAIDDPTRPAARVMHGPSCRPGGLVVEVQAGTTPYSVRLATTRQPAGEAEALLAPGESTVLRSGDVAWGETIDGRLEFAAQDGSGDTFVDELEDYSFTRPTQEDCAAVTAPAFPELAAPVRRRPHRPPRRLRAPTAGTGRRHPRCRAGPAARRRRRRPRTSRRARPLRRPGTFPAGPPAPPPRRGWRPDRP